MFQVLFGDDEHTAAEGPYRRLLRVRKWLYVSSAAALMLAFGLYHEDGVTKILEVIDIPSWLVRQTILGGLIYLIVQYSLLLVQLIVSYDIVLRRRFVFRQADDAADATDRLVAAEERLNAIRDKIEPGRVAQIAKLTKELTSARQFLEMKKADLDFLEGDIRKSILESDPAEIKRHESDVESKRSAVREAERAVDEIDRRILHVQNGTENGVEGNLERELWAAENAYAQLRRYDPAQRLGYKMTEVVLDIIRIVPPLVVSIYSVFQISGAHARI